MSTAKQETNSSAYQKQCKISTFSNYSILLYVCGSAQNMHIFKLPIKKITEIQQELLNSKNTKMVSPPPLAQPLNFVRFSTKKYHNFHTSCRTYLLILFFWPKVLRLEIQEKKSLNRRFSWNQNQTITCWKQISALQPNWRITLRTLRRQKEVWECH